MAVRVDGLCVPHFLEVRSFPYVNLLVVRDAVVSPVGLRKLRLRPLSATCSRFALATQRSAGSELIPCSGARANACSLHRRHHEP